MRKIVIVGLLISLIIAGVVSYFASERPDGLERVAEDKGFGEEAQEPGFSVLPDYTVPLIESEEQPSRLRAFLSTAIAGIVGTLIVFAACIVIGKLLTAGPRVSKPEEGHHDQSESGEASKQT